MRLDDLPTSSRRFVARVSASTDTVDRSPGRGGGSRAADYEFALVFAVPTVANEDSAEAPAATTSVARPRLLPGARYKGLTQSIPRARPRPSQPRLDLRRPSRWRLFQTASPLGRAGVQQQKLVRHPLLSTMASGPAGSPGHRPGELKLRREPAAAACSARRRDPYSYRPAGPHGTTSV